MLEPRRLATRLAAARVAEERGEPLGESVGYQIRFEERSSPRTRLRFVTEGVLARRLLADPGLERIGAVVLDEFHERHLQGDLALALLRQLQGRGHPLKLLVMSATLETGPLSAFLGDCPVLTSEGRTFPVDVSYLDRADSRPLEEQVLAALKRLLPALPAGDVLVFLPGAQEIRRAQTSASDFASRHGFTVLPLHGDLPAAEQDRAVRPDSGRKLILSTNVAESSVTIPGVVAVIDSGLARLPVHSPWSGLPSLQTTRVSQASATQRAGRAGRTQPGRALRLYTRTDFDARPPHEAPEIARSDLSDMVLALAASGVTDRRRFAFFQTPPPAALEAAERLLLDLGALEPSGGLTQLGQRMLAFPLHPRLARVVAEGEHRGVGRVAATAAALLGERDVRRSARTRLDGPRRKAQATTSARSDVLERLADISAQGAMARELDPAALAAVERASRQLVRLVKEKTAAPATEEAREEALLLSLLTGFPDRVAKRRRAHAAELLLSSGGSATLDEGSAVQESMLLLALDAEVRTSPRGPETRVRVASEVKEEWLLELFPERLRDVAALEWNAAQSRVDEVGQLLYGELLLDESRKPAAASAAASRVLAEHLKSGGLSGLLDAESLESWSARLALLAKVYPEVDMPRPPPDPRTELPTLLAEGRTDLSGLDAQAVQQALDGLLPPRVQALLNRALPSRVTLPGGKGLTVHYPLGAPAYVASRLQDFFGLREGPRLGEGRLPLVLHLLAPNQRPVQVTTDLAGFWERHYPTLRRELARRYPRHAWPLDPAHATPPPQGPRRRP